MKYFIIAGEPSGDLHGSDLIRSLAVADPDCDIACWGGDLMREAGARLLMHYRETAFMGLWEVIINIRKVKANFAVCRKQIAEMKPDVVILIDYPGFNLRIARYVHHMGIKVFYYISPKFWAWREGRVSRIKKYVDRLYIIFPFEKEFYKRHDYPVTFLGNPLVDHIESWRSKASDRNSIITSLGLDKRPVIALLSGSRLQEVSKILPEMVKIIPDFPEYQFVVAAMDHLPSELYKNITEAYPLKLIYGKTYDLLSVAEAALVTSGTATLEAALFDVPQVVCYKTSPVTYYFAMKVLKVHFISLVNLIMDREVVKEVLQNDLNRVRLRSELQDVTVAGKRYNVIKNDYSELRMVLKGEGASRRVADDIVMMLRMQQKK